MTVFNSQAYVKEAVESILRQTLADFEFVIVDDGSTDKTLEIIQSFKDPRIVLFKNNQNQGQTKSLNIGLRQCRAAFIARMDADDISDPKRLQLQYDFLQANSKVGLVGSACVDINAQGKRIRLNGVPIDPQQIKAYLAASGDLSYWCIYHPTVMIRKNVLDQAGFYDEKSGEGQGYPHDYELWSRLIRRCDFANLPQPLLKYRILPASDSRFYSDKQIKDRDDVSLKKIKSYCPNLNEEDRSILLQLLEFRPQRNQNHGKKVFDLFTYYFKLYMDSEKFMDELKLYYLPQLWKTNPGLSLKTFFQLVARHPAFLLNGKFYRKIVKVALHSGMSKKDYQFVTKKMLSYR